MFFRTPLLTPLPKGRTHHVDAWKDEYYETYRLTAELPAVPVAGSHPSHRARQEGARIFPENLSLPAISPIEVPM